MNFYTYSVALCTYNGEKFIEAQLSSIIKQTLRVNEIIICDDNSSDNTIEIINSFAKKKSYGIPITLYKNQEKLGVTKNFEKCIGKCSSNYIFLCDQDDVWLNNKVEEFDKVFKNGFDLVLSDSYVTNSELLVVSKSLLSNFKFNSLNLVDSVLSKSFVTGANLAFNKKVFNKAHPFPPSTLHDKWLGMIGAFFFKFKIIKLPLLKYRQHSNNVIGVKKLSLLSKIKLNFANKNRRDFSVNTTFKSLQTFWFTFSDELSEKQRFKTQKVLKFWRTLDSFRNYNKIKSFTLIIFNFFNYFRYSFGLLAFLRDIIILL